MHSYGRLRGPLRGIIKSIGPPYAAPRTPRRFISGVQTQPSRAREELELEVPLHHCPALRSARTSDDAFVSNEKLGHGVGSVESTLPSQPYTVHATMKEPLEAPQPELGRSPRRIYSQAYKGAYKAARRMKSNSLQHHYQYQLEWHGYDDAVSWPVVLNMLTQATPSGIHIHVKRMETIRLADGDQGVFKGGSRAAIAEVMQRTGSHVVEVVPSVPSGEAFHTLTLYGRPDQNLKAGELLRSLILLDSESTDAEGTEPHMLRLERTGESDGKKHELQEGSTKAHNAEDTLPGSGYAGTPVIRPALSVRAYWHDTKIRNMTAEERLARRPQQWDTLQFTKYVELLTARTPFLYRSKGRHAGVQTSDPSYFDLMTNELLELFIHLPELKVHISSDAVDAAFTFLSRLRDIPNIHRIMSAIEHSSDCSLTASNFDILLAHAAKVGDVHNFKYVLQVMLQHQLNPTERTWLRFHELVCKRVSPDAAAKVVQRMSQKGLLASPKAVREIADNMMLPALVDYMNTPKATISHLLRAIDKTVSIHLESHRTQPAKSWLTVSAANKMINFSLSEGREQDALMVLHEILRRDEKLSTDTLNTFLTSKARAFDLDGSLAILQHFHDLSAIPEHAVKLDTLSFHLLFRLAHRKKFYNAMRVVWRYACVSGQMPRVLPDMVHDSLYSYLPAFEEWEMAHGQFEHNQDNLPHVLPPLTQMNTSFGLWGKFVVGVSQGLELPITTAPLTYDETVQYMAERRSFRELTSLESSILQFARSPRPESLTESLAELPQPQALKTALREDLSEHLSSSPTLPFLKVFRKAWELDMAMKKAKLNSLPRDIKVGDEHNKREETLRAHLADMLENMFAWGIDVPMEISTKRAEIYL